MKLDKQILHSIFNETIKLTEIAKNHFNENKAIDSIIDFYAEFEIQKPSKFFTYENEDQLLDQFNEWSKYATSIPTSWDYNIPLTNPSSFYQWIVRKDPFHLGYKRVGPGLLTEIGENIDAGDKEVPGGLISDIWMGLGEINDIEKICDNLDLKREVISEDDRVDELVNNILDINSPDSAFESAFIGNTSTFVLEHIEIQYLIEAHNIKRNTNYTEVLKNLINSCCTVLAFSEVCIICK